jgi:hypothetical protein
MGMCNWSILPIPIWVTERNSFQEQSYIQTRLEYIFSTTQTVIMYNEDTRTTLIAEFEQLLHRPTNSYVTGSSPDHH